MLGRNVTRFRKRDLGYRGNINFYKTVSPILTNLIRHCGLALHSSQFMLMTLPLLTTKGIKSDPKLIIFATVKRLNLNLYLSGY